MKAITDLRNSSKVSSVQRGVEHDWIVITEAAHGPAPNVAEVFADHTDAYTLTETTHTDDDAIAHFTEVTA